MAKGSGYMMQMEGFMHSIATKSLKNSTVWKKCFMTGRMAEYPGVHGNIPWTFVYPYREGQEETDGIHTGP